MSLLDKASLIVTPNSYKESVLYSVVPNTTLGDMDVVRATTATRVNSEGLIEVVPRNLLTYSEQFENANWTKSSITIIANDTISPNGIINADKATLSTASGRLSQSVTLLANTQFTLSTFIKNIDASNSKVRILVINNANTVCTSSFILTESGSIVEQSNATGTITAYDNGWYRCSITFNSETGITTPNIRVLSAVVGGFTTNESVYIWGAQLEEGSLTEYFPTTTRLNIPRIDYTNGSCPSILVEPQRTNLFIQSDAVSGGSGGFYSEPFDWGLGLIKNSVVSVNNGYYYPIWSGVAFSTICTMSFYVKMEDGSEPIANNNSLPASQRDINITIFSDTSNSTLVKEYIKNGIWRFSVTATNNNNNFNIGVSKPSNYSTKQFRVGGFQIEAGSNATSYIPTVASAVTRNADVISKTGIADLIGQTEGTIFVDFNLPILSDGNIFVVGNAIDYLKIITTSSGYIVGVRKANNDYQQILGAPSNPKGRYKFIIKYNSTEFSTFRNGIKIGTKQFSEIASYNDLSLSTNQTNINSAMLYKTALTDEQCISLTTL